MFDDGLKMGLKEKEEKQEMHKKYIEDMNEEAQSINFDDLLSDESFMFNKKNKYLEDVNLWKNNLSGDHRHPNIGTKIHIGFQPFAMKRVLKIVDGYMEKWCKDHGLEKTMEYKVANPNYSERFKKKFHISGFFDYSAKNISSSQAGKQLVIYPILDKHIEKDIPEKFNEEIKKMEKKSEYFKNLYCTLSFADGLSKAFDDAVEKGELTEDDFIPVKNDFVIGNYVHFRFGKLAGEETIQSENIVSKIENKNKTLEDDRAFPLPNIFFEEDGKNALTRFLTLIKESKAEGEISLYYDAIYNKTKETIVLQNGKYIPEQKMNWDSNVSEPKKYNLIPFETAIDIIDYSKMEKKNK